MTVTTEFLFTDRMDYLKGLLLFMFCLRLSPICNRIYLDDQWSYFEVNVFPVFGDMTTHIYPRQRREKQL